jgi:sugar/nucleoside kinase (ribokinase family)
MISIAGSSVWDHIIYTSQLPSRGQTVPAKNILEACGGSASNTAAWASSQGIDVNFFTTKAHGPKSELYRNHAGKLDTLQLEYVSQSEQDLRSVYVMVDSTGERSMIFEPNREKLEDHINTRQKELLSNSSLFWLGSNQGYKRAKYQEILKDLPVWCGMSSTFIEKEVQATRTWQFIVSSLAQDPMPQFEQLNQLGTKFCVMTDGSKGGIFWVHGTDEWIPYKPFPVANPIDATGAGDAFLAGLLVGLYEYDLTQFDITMAQAVCTAGSKLGAKAVGNAGAWPGIIN